MTKISKLSAIVRGGKETSGAIDVDVVDSIFIELFDDDFIDDGSIKFGKFNDGDDALDDCCDDVCDFGDFGR